MRPIILTVCFLIYSNCQGQLVADFSTTDGKTGGCSPYIVSFKNLTQGASATAVYKWDLGNGTTSTGFNPGATYIDEKIYTVTLTVTDNDKTESKSLYVNVYKKPTADFIVDKIKGCIPLAVMFTSTSQANDGDIRSYFWDFGDGLTVSKIGSDTIAHTYTIGQKLNVRLVVLSSFGCQNSIQKLNVTEAVEPPKSDFISDKTILCKSSDVVNFKTTATIFDAVNYLWDFGDGTTSTQKTPAHKFAKKGTFDVKLTVSNAAVAGCSTVTAKPALINVSNFNSDFTVSSPLCNNTNTVFQNNSLPTPTAAQWYTTDDKYKTVTNGNTLSKLFTTPGALTVRLINTFDICKDTVEKKISINQASSLQGFQLINNNICGAPAAVSFKDTNYTSVKWKWYFSLPGIKDSSIIQTPSFQYTANGNYTVGLTIADAAGCMATTSKTVSIQKPDISIYILSSTGADKISGCSGLSIKFAATNPANITDYSWSFGGEATSNQPQPVYDFNQLKDYSITLNYTTTTGCKGSVVYDTKISVKQKPTAAFTISSQNVCGSGTVLFADQSTPQTDRWSWAFGDNTFSGLSSSYKNISHQYADSGTYSVQLIAYNGGCSDTLIKKALVHVSPPFSKITAAINTCNGTRGVVNFSQSSMYANDCNWIFGDGVTAVTSTTETHATHEYKKSGVYHVFLTTNYKTCSSVDSVNVYVLLKQQPVLSADKTEMCGSDSLMVSINNLQINPYKSTNGYAVLKWQYDDYTNFAGTVFGTPASWINSYSGGLTNLKSGKENLMAITQSAYFGCIDTSTFISLKIEGPDADFMINNNASCYKSVFNFTDTSSRNNALNIKARIWNFGDDSSSINTDNNFISHNFKNPGSYVTTFKIVDDKGCSDISTLKTIVSGPKTNFNWLSMPVMPGSTTTFVNTTNAFNSKNVKYLWHFSNNNYSDTAASKVIRKYGNISMDTVILIAADAGNHCADTSIQLVPINKMYVPFTFTSKYIDSNNCPPLVLYTSSSIVNADSVRWNFGDGSLAGNMFSPSHTYSKPGIYKITLYGFINDVIDSTFDYITIKGPYATLTADAYQKCTPATVILSAALRNAVSYAWDFNDGELIHTIDSIVTHNYTKPGIYNPSLVMKDSAGCTAAFNLPAKILMDTLSATMNADAHAICDSNVVTFTSDVVSIAVSDDHQTLHYKWFFGTPDNAVSTNQDAAFLYQGAGKYTVTLMVQSNPGCVARVTDTIRVNPFPIVNAGPGKYLLHGSSYMLQPTVSDSTVSYSWSPSLYLDNDTIKNPLSTPLNSQTYTLTATTTAGCSASDTVGVFVLGELNIPNAFSPNGDGINDTWKIKFLNDYPGSTIDVYDRTGQIVFTSKGYATEWDGTFNGKPLPIGTYYYLANPKNTSPVFSGSVTIIR